MTLRQAISSAFAVRFCVVVLSSGIVSQLISQQQQPTTLYQSFIRTVGVVVVEALPSGAAGCAGDSAAVLGFHGNFGNKSISKRIGDTGTLSKFNTTLYIHNVPGPNYTFPQIPTNSFTVTNTNSTNSTNTNSTNVTTPSIFNGGTELYWRVRARARLQIRGVLLRVQPADDVEFTLTGDSFLREADACFTERGNVEGMTHATRELKKNVTGTMRFDKDGIVKIDLTVVFVNGRVAPGDQSYYAHSSFEIDIRNSPPSNRPDNAPVGPPPPTMAPVDDRCAKSTCRTFFALLSGRLYNRFYGGQCRETCAATSLFAPSLFGWRCGGCF